MMPCTLRILLWCHRCHKKGNYNPRMNVVYLLDVSKIPEDVISTVETEVIGY